LGLTKARASESWAAATAWLRDQPATATCRPALSPHAPYSVRASLYRAIAALNYPVMTHLAETLAELQLLTEHVGPFVPFLKGVGVWDPDGLVRSAAQVCGMYGAAPRVLFAHGNYLDPETPLGPN